MRRLLGLVTIAALLCSGCAARPYDPPAEAQIDVDTPQLRRAKAAAGVEDCRPGDGRPREQGGLPPVVLPCFGGGPDVALAHLRGPLVVNLWASWCGPCREEMPVLQRFHEQYGARVPIVGIDYEDVQTEAAMDLVREAGVTYPLLADPQAALRGEPPFPGRMGLPLFVFVDEDARAEVVAGGVGSLGELEAMVEEHLEVTL